MQGIRHTDGSQPRMEPHKVLPVVSSDVDILAVFFYVDERSYAEIPKRTSTVPGRDRNLQKTSAHPPNCDYERVKKSW